MPFRASWPCVLPVVTALSLPAVASQDPLAQPPDRGQPRSGGPDLNQNVDVVEWQNYVTGAQNSLRMLAELTGGFATVNKNDFAAALKRIDAETSDYYMIGYGSSNPDPAKRRRTIEVKVKRPLLEVYHRTEYVLPSRTR